MSVPQLPQPRRTVSFYYGWAVLPLAALAMFFSGPGQTFSVSIFIPAYLHDFGWSRTTVSALYSAATIAAGMCMVGVGRLIDRLGCRRMGAVVGILLGLACVWNSFAANQAMLAAGFFFVRLLGQGSMMLIAATLVSQWFERRRGRAFSLLSLGIFASTAVFPPLNVWMIGEWGWPAAWRAWAVLLWLAFVPAFFIVVRNTPEECGLPPDRSTGHEAGTTQPEEEWHQWTLAEALRNPTFHRLLICTALPPLLNTGINFHLLSIMGEHGVGSGAAAFALSVTALSAFPVSLLAGVLNDRIKANVTLAAMFVLQFAVLAALLRTDSPTTAILFGLLWGAASGLESNSIGTIYPQYFGRKHIASIRGASMIATVLGSALGPVLFGAAYDLFGGYAELLLLCGIFPAAGIALALLSKAPRRVMTASDLS